MKPIYALIAAIFCCNVALAMEWHNPENCKNNPMQGQYWQGEERENFFDKLPLRAKNSLSQEEWHTANLSGGLSVRFRTSSPNISIKYKASTAIDRSSVELYGTDNNGSVRDFEGQGSCEGDVATHQFSSIEFSGSVHKSRGYDYQLWLPPHHKVEELEIGVDDGAFFAFKDCREELPIVICSTDGYQESWNLKLSLLMDRPIISFDAPSAAVEMLATQVEAKAFVLDGTQEKMGRKELSKRVEVVKKIRDLHPSTPIVISQRELLERLHKSGVEGVYLVESGDKADVYETKLRELLSCPQGSISTTKPTTQCRSGAIEWHDQCGYILKELREGRAKSAVVGNSIVQNWSSNTTNEKRYGGGKAGRAGLECWNKYMDGFINMGIGSDRVENLLWRVYNDQFEITEFEQIIIMIGTNNLRLKNSYDEIAEGIENLIKQIQVRQPKARITVVGVLPRKDIPWAQLQTLNDRVERASNRCNVEYRNVGAVLLDENDIPIDELYSDGVHLSSKGYMLYGEALMGK